MAVGNKDEEDEVERIRKGFEEGLREAVEEKAKVEPEESQGWPEEKPREAQATGAGVTTAIDVNAIVSRASVLFHLDGASLELFRTYLSYAQRNSEFVRWLGRLPTEDDIRVLGAMLSMQLALEKVFKQKPTTTYFDYIVSRVRVVFNDSIHTLQCYDPNLGVYIPSGPSPQCKYRIMELIRSVNAVLDRIPVVTLKKKEERWVTVVEPKSATDFESTSFFREVETKLEDHGLLTFKDLTRRPHMVAFPNGFYLDLDELIYNTKNPANPIDFNPDYYVTIRLGAPVDLTVLRELVPNVPITRPGANNREEYRKEYLEFMSNAFRTYAPNLHSYFLDWVNTEEYAVLLLELIGFTMYPDYPLRAIFVLLGGGNDPMKSGGNGKSTFLSLLERVVGEHNVVHIEFQKLVKSEFAASELAGKLANIVPDMSASAIEDTAILKALSGGDYISANVKFKPFIKFKNMAKLIASMNEFPYFNDRTKAMQDRLHIIPFPNVFPDDASFRNDLLNHSEIPRLVALALTALRAVLNRGWFVTKGMNEVYNTTIDPVGEFMRQLLSTGVLGCRAVLDKNARTPREELYALFERWREENNVTRSVPKQMFSAQLGRWGIAVVRDKAKNYYYKGIQLTCENTETIEQYNEEGEEFNEE